ncbi:hypothetical protein RP20_CCG007633 [Aedes albopictus]|nr:hypothetical protein RP20_CCG007633 [Aedes albopictus]
MTDCNSLDFTIAYQCIEVLERDYYYWTRLECKGSYITGEVSQAKELILEQIYNLAAGAALRTHSACVWEELQYWYRELKKVIAKHRQAAASRISDRGVPLI